MEDVITAVPPPSRFFPEDLNNFTPPSPPVPPPVLSFSASDPNNPMSPSLLIIAMSSPSLDFFRHISSKTLIGTLSLPEIPSSGSNEPSLRDKSCNIYALNINDKLIVAVTVQHQVSTEKSQAVAKLLICHQIVPEKVLILDSVQSRNFRGKLPPDETFAFKLETLQQRKEHSDGCGGSMLLKGVDYFPSGSLVDGLGAALLGRCQMKKVKGTLYVSWPESGGSVASMVKSLLLKDVLPGLEYGTDVEGEDLSSRFGRRNVRPRDFELYI